MQFWIGVENFAKIESAKICVDNYTVLVGPNNSGKTFLMQLVQGVRKHLFLYLDSLIFEKIIMKALRVKRTEEYSEYEVDTENISVIVSCINAKLSLEKETIVKSIFGKEIPIEKLYVDAVLEENASYKFKITNASSNYFKKNIDILMAGFDSTAISLVKSMQNDTICIANKMFTDERENIPCGISYATYGDDRSMLWNALQFVFESQSLFLPASRTGLLLLYREFFANKTDKEVSYISNGTMFPEEREKFANLTQPMYEFLRFLQTYSENERLVKKYQEELTFFEEHLIEGHINVNERGVLSYRSKNEDAEVPMYLASSMVKEIAPLLLALTPLVEYNRLIIDEIEASLHPQKQLEMVRFLNRLNNKGMKLIVSTHSDTFAVKLNNLYILSEAVKAKGESVLQEFDLEKADLINPEKLYVYEFVIQTNGKSVVKQIHGNKETGFQFDAFTNSALHLYDEGIKLGEIQ